MPQPVDKASLTPGESRKQIKLNLPSDLNKWNFRTIYKLVTEFDAEPEK